MKYERKNIVSNLYETSKASTGQAMLGTGAAQYDVYHLDAMKEQFCRFYRHSENIKSCDAYYYDTKNHLIVEFKNTHHMRLKEYYDEIEIKLLDTHMLCRETFWRSRKLNAIIGIVNVIVVYNDALNYGSGVRNIAGALNQIRPLQGDIKRYTKEPEQFLDEDEFLEKVKCTKEKYEKDFYNEIEFIDKKDFEERYIKTGYFSGLEIWSEIC